MATEFVSVISALHFQFLRLDGNLHEAGVGEVLYMGYPISRLEIELRT